MSRAWNGADLVTEFSALLGDTSSAFQSRVLGWLNDGVFEIGTKFDWAFHKAKGKKILASGTEEHSLEVAAPSTPTVSALAGGSLTADSACYVKVTYVQANGVESLPSPASAAITPTGGNLSITVGISVSSEALVTARNIYLKQGSGEYYYYGQVANNSAVTTTITANTSSTIEPPDYEAIRKVSGSPFFESTPSIQLTYRAIEQLRMICEGAFPSGGPEFYDHLSHNSIITYPLPSSNMTASFYYYRNPFKLYNSSDSQPDLPIDFKPVLKAYVIAMGYEYRDRDGQGEKFGKFQTLLEEAVSRYGNAASAEYAIRDVYGNPDGWEVG